MISHRKMGIEHPFFFLNFVNKIKFKKKKYVGKVGGHFWCRSSVKYHIIWNFNELND